MKPNAFYAIHRGFFSPEEVEIFDWHPIWVDWGPSPKRLGKSSQQMFGNYKGKFHGRLPRDLKLMADKLATLVPQQRFTTACLRRYEKGQGVKPHRDPRSFLGFTVIGVFGAWEGGEVAVEKARFPLHAGDALVQRCYIKGKRRPLHRVTPVTKGTRYSLIINTTS